MDTPAVGLSILDIVETPAPGWSARATVLPPARTRWCPASPPSAGARTTAWCCGTTRSSPATHAQIIADEDVFRLTDLGSTNGTF